MIGMKTMHIAHIFDVVTIKKSDGTSWDSEICAIYYDAYGIPSIISIENHNVNDINDYYYYKEMHYLYYNHKELTFVDNNMWYIDANIVPLSTTLFGDNR